MPFLPNFSSRTSGVEGLVVVGDNEVAFIMLGFRREKERREAMEREEKEALFKSSHTHQ
jgi:hypothetical protein